MPRSRKAAAGGGGGGTGKTKAGGASKPKKKRRAVAGVGVDFSRVKRKVGRTLAPAANATDTTVTAKSITLPSQSVAANRGRGATTTADRDLTLRELLAQLSHYSAKVRRDALLGIAELAAAAPEEVRRHSGGIVGESKSSSSSSNGVSSSSASPLEALAERAADPDPEVRAALRRALSAVAAAVGPLGVVPFLPLLMAHARRAMGSPDPRTRADALSLAAEAVAAAKGSRSSSSSSNSGSGRGGGGLSSLLVGPALAACSAQLNPAARARSLKAGSLKSLQASLQGVRAFLEAASERGGGREEEEEEAEGDDGDDEEGERAGDEGGPSAAAAALEGSRSLRPLYSFRCAWALNAVAPAAEGSDDDEGDGGGGGGGERSDEEGSGTAADHGTTPLPAGVASLLAALCSAWGDLCPKGLLFQGGGAGGEREGAQRNRATAAADEDDDVERSLAACDLLACARLLLISCSSSSSSSPAVAAAAIRAASPLGRAVGSALPAPPPSGKGTARKDALDAAAALNLEAAKFLSRLLLVSPSSGGIEAASLPPWTARLLGWCDAALATGDALPRSGAGSGDGGGNGKDDDGGDNESSKKKRSKPSSSPALLRPLPDAALASVVSASERGLAALGARERSAAHASSLSALTLRSLPGSRARGVAVGAIARALLLSGAVSEEAAAANWVPLLPRVVWEEAAAIASNKKGGKKRKSSRGVGGATAAAALAALHAAARRCSPEWNRAGNSSSPLASALKVVAPSLAPLVLVMPPPATATAAEKASAVVTAAPGALSRLPLRCALLFADALEHLPCLLPAPLLRSLVAALACTSSPYPPEFGERALAAASRAVASAAAAVSDEDDDESDNENGNENNATGISPEDARAWASALLFLLSGAGERVQVVESSSSRKGRGNEETKDSSSPLVLWRRHARAVAAATRALRASSGSGGVKVAVGLLSDGLLEAAGVKKDKKKNEEEETEGSEGRAAAGALAALCAVSDPDSSRAPSRLLDSVPLLVAAYARGGGCSPALSSAGMGAELALQALWRRTGTGSGTDNALAETLDLLLLSPSSPSSPPPSPSSLASSCALIGAIAGDSSLRASLLEERAAAAARSAVSRARDAAAAAAKARVEEEVEGGRPAPLPLPPPPPMPRWLRLSALDFFDF